MQPKLLIVEDDPTQADVLARLLGSKGYFADVVDNGRDAVRRLNAGTFDVALIDYRIPDIDGVGVARVVRNLTAPASRAMLIALTSSPQELAHDIAEFDLVLAKPVDLKTLLSAIEHGRHRAMEPNGLPCRPTPQTIAEETRAVAENIPRAADAGKRGRILLADDDPYLREFLKLTLEACQLHVDLAENGLQAITLIETGSYDVVVVDFSMPKLDGLAAAKIIYDLTARLVRPRIVALTSTPDRIVAQDPKWSLVLDGIVAKSSGPRAILSLVLDYLDYKAQQLRLPRETIDISNLMAMESIVSADA